jgi:hypothetical protein
MPEQINLEFTARESFLQLVSSNCDCEEVNHEILIDFHVFKPLNPKFVFSNGK